MVFQRLRDQFGQTGVFRLAAVVVVIPFLTGRLVVRTAVVAVPHEVDDLLEERIGTDADLGQRLVRYGGNVTTGATVRLRSRQRRLDGVNHTLNLRTVLSQLRPELAAADHLIAGHLEHLKDSRPVVLYDTGIQPRAADLD